MKRLLSLLLCLSVLGVTTQVDARWYRDDYYNGYYHGPRYGYYDGGVVADVGAGVGAAAEGVGRGAANIIDSVLPW
jgi:hypothetical protein